jgi:hypothetical protein
MKTVHHYKVYTNHYGAPGEFVQSIQLFRLNEDTVRVRSENGNISNVPTNRFHVHKSTDALIYVPRCNHVGYILEEYSL